jgi:hypothetical protein
VGGYKWSVCIYYILGPNRVKHGGYYHQNPDEG